MSQGLNYLEALKLALTIILLLGYLFKICKVYHDRTCTQNRLSYWPFCLIFAMLTTVCAGIVETGAKSMTDHIDDVTQTWLVFFAGQISCFFWSELLLMQAFEWELITSLITFQKDVAPEEIGVKREEYMNIVEPKTTWKFYIATAYNITFHATKVILFCLEKTNKIKQNSDMPWYLQVVYWNAGFVLSLAFIVIIAGVRLLFVSAAHCNSEYQTHKLQIKIMMGCILICEPSNFYAVIMQVKIDESDRSFRYFVQMCLLLTPPFVYLIVKKTEDCLACFNRHPTRYSAYQYSNRMKLVTGVGYVETKGNLIEQQDQINNSKLSPGADVQKSQRYGTVETDPYLRCSDLVQEYAGDYCGSLGSRDDFDKNL